MKILIKNPKGKIENYFLKMRYIFFSDTNY